MLDNLMEETKDKGFPLNNVEISLVNKTGNAMY